MIRASMLPQNPPCELVRVLAEPQYGDCGGDRAEHGNQHAVPLDASDDPHQPGSGILYGPDVSIENLLDVCIVQHLRNSHSNSPSLVFGAAASAKGKVGTGLTYVASELSPSPTLYGDLSAQVDSTCSDLGTLHAVDPCNSRVTQLTSRQHVGRGRFDRAAGSHMRDAIHSRNSVPLPSGSLPVSQLEISNSLQTSIDIGVAMFWIAYFLIILTGLGLSCWALLKAIHLL